MGTAQKLLQQVNYDLTHLHGERSEQYRDLKAKEQAMKGNFLISVKLFSLQIFIFRLFREI